MTLHTPYEIALDAAFAEAGLSVRHEPKCFRSHGKDNLGFRPDFYLPALNLYIEVGILERKKSKARMMKKHYPQIKLLIIDNIETQIYCEVAPDNLAAFLTLAAQTDLTGMSGKKRLRTVYELSKECELA
jgi:hypothetical protein